ncbi:exocyst complex component 1-like isoform X1 [Haliotis rufescens]|uniref:exocyst complex component 1-like isoform X1 n=1 Tax=Haliotis rufescens TaxID=6454 RepID=UPI00201F1FA7|nr:exocyst complex component 1-like isoform X1 [Haliotis rufescens]
MAAIKHTLNRDLFLPNDERLIGLIYVFKAPKKKKGSFLCAVLNQAESPVQARVYQVKKADRGESYKKKLSWLLRDLKIVDGKNANKETAEFDLNFEKLYKWVASSIDEKESFIACLWRLSQRYLIQKPEFVNVPPGLLEDITAPHDQNQKSEGGDDISIEDEDYQALSSKEESDLELLMSECKVAISNAETFTDQLSRQLSVLDGANIHSIMGSEDQVLNLMRLLDEGIQQAERIERKLDSYDNILLNVKEQMEVMRDKDMLVKIRNINHQQLLEELERVVNQLDLDVKHVDALVNGDLATPNGIYECTRAAQALLKCMNANIHPAVRRMAAVEEQQKRFSKLSVSFSKRVAHHLNNLFIHQGNELGETLSRFSGELKMPIHDTMQRELVVYADLMLWLKNTDLLVFEELTKVYTVSMNKMYTRELQDFLENAKQRLMGKSEKGSKYATLTKLSGSSTSLGKISELRGRSSSMQSVDRASLGSDQDLAQRGPFEQTLEKVLSELERVCVAEQDFCYKFFQLIEKTPSVSDAKGSPGQHNVSAEDDSEVWTLRNPSNVAEDYFMENLGEGLLQKRSTSQLRQINDAVRSMMAALFPTLECELDNFFVFADQRDGLNSMYMLVKLSAHVNHSQDMGSFLSKTFGNCLVKVKRNFDKYIQVQIRGVEETKVSKKNRCGIISFVHNFEDFANLAERIFKGSNRHADLEKAYAKLVQVIFEQIVRVATEQQKNPREVVMMENFHRMYSILSQLKLSCLENERKDAKQRYWDNLRTYTTTLLGRPLEKLHIFFEGVEKRVASGVKPEEVGFQLAFSKQELRKVIKEYPGKEVKKNLEHLNKKVEKQLSDEEHLLEVVWREMQDEFIKQYKHYDDLSKKCYPDMQITLDFSIDDVLEFFSSIARSH